MGQSKDQTQIPAVKVVTERSHLPKNLESRLQAAWLSAVAPPSGRKVKPAEPSSAISSSDHPKLTKTENRSGSCLSQWISTTFLYFFCFVFMQLS